MANAEHLALVRQGAEATNKFASENRGVALDLSGADLSGLSLQGCNLSDANLAGSNLSGSDLRQCVLGGADLRGSNLQRANVTDAALHRAKLQNADLRGITVGPIGVGRQLICTSANTFENARWDKERIEEVLRVLNLNRDWEIRYEIVPKA